MRCSICRHDIIDDAAFCPFCTAAVPGAPAYDDYRFDAFVSYRHLEKDQQLAQRIQRSLEGMAVPKALQGKARRQKLGKLFRDQDELPTSASLGGQIEEALRQSGWLIVICSPETRASQWVSREVELFASYHGRDRILLALAAGEPQTSFPPLLLSRLAPAADGTIVQVADEPIAADFRPHTRKRYPAELARIAAPLMGCGYDDLRQRQQARTRRLAALVASALTLASTTFGAFSWHQQRQIEANLHAAQARESESLAAQAEQLLAQGERWEAIQVALAALPVSEASGDRPLVPSAQLALERALQVYPSTSTWRSCYTASDVKRGYALATDGTQAFERDDGTVVLQDVADGTERATLDARGELQDITGSEVSDLDLQFCGNRLLCVANGGIVAFDCETAERSWRAAVDGLLRESDVACTADGDKLALAVSYGPSHAVGDNLSDACIVRVIDAASGAVSTAFKLPLRSYIDHTDEVRLAFSPDGGRLAVANTGRLWVIDLADGSVAWAELPDAGAHELTFTDTSLVVVTVSGSELTLYTDPAQVSCYAHDLSPRWSLAYDPTFAYDADGLPLDTDARMVGTYLADDGGRQLVLAIGRSVRYVDELSGEETLRIETAAPLRACSLDGLLHCVDQAGNVLTYPPASSETIGEVMGTSIAAGSYASLAKTADGTYLAAYDATRSTYHVYRFAALSDVAGRTPITNKYLHANLSPVQAGGTTWLASWDDTELALLDANSFKRQWKHSFAKLCGFEGTVACLCDDGSIYVYEPTHEGGAAPAVAVVDAATGVTSDRIVLGDSWPRITSARVQQAQERTVLVLTGLSSAGVFDVASHEELVHIETQGSYINQAWLVGDALLTLETAAFGDNASAFGLYALADGAPREADICQCRPRFALGAPLWAPSPDGSLLVASCTDGYLRAFASDDLSLAWQSSTEFAKLQAVCFAADGQTLLAQDASGTCLLLSAADGQTLAASTATLPPIRSSWPDASTPDELAVSYGTEGQVAGQGIAIISMNPDCFGPLSDTPCGLWYTPDHQSVLCLDKLDAGTQPFSRIERLALDDLIARAHQIVAGHELTLAQRQLYHID